MKIQWKNPVVIAIIGLVIFVGGFFAGSEFRAFQFRNAIKNAFNFSDTSATPTPNTLMDQAKDEKYEIIQKGIGDEVTLATMNIKITSAVEKQILSSKYSTPVVAKEGTKFVVVSMEVTNTTSSAFDFPPDMIVVDNQEREFSVYSDEIGNVDNYMDYRSLSPSIKQTGVMVYEIPTDSASYSFVVAKAGTKELYKIVLK